MTDDNAAAAVDEGGWPTGIFDQKAQTLSTYLSDRVILETLSRHLELTSAISHLESRIRDLTKIVGDLADTMAENTATTRRRPRSVIIIPASNQEASALATELLDA